MIFRQQNYLRFMLMLTSVLTSITLNMAASAQDTSTPEAAEAQTGTFVETPEGHLVVYTDSGPIDLGPATSVYSAPDNSSLVWVTETEDGSAEIRRYTWANGKTTALYREARSDDSAPLPVITEYNGSYIGMIRGNGQSFGFVTGIFIPGITPETSRPASFNMPLFFYQYGKFGTTLAWDKDAEFLMDLGGGEAGHSTPLFSPDGNFTASVITPPSDFGILSVTRTNDLESAGSLTSTALAYYWDVAPIWRWGSTALGYVEFTDENRTEAQFISFDIVTEETTILFDGLPITDGYNFPQPILWTPEIVAMRYRPDSVTAFIIVYDDTGEEIQRIEISDLDTDPDSYVILIVPVVTDENVEIGLYYPDRRAWALLDPRTGDLHYLGKDEWIALVPQTTISEAMYGKIINPADGGERIVEMHRSEGTLPVVIEHATEGLSLSPDGHFYTYLADKVLYMMGADGEQYSYDSGIGIHPPSVSWSSLVGVVIPKPAP